MERLNSRTKTGGGFGLTLHSLTHIQVAAIAQVMSLCKIMTISPSRFTESMTAKPGHVLRPYCSGWSGKCVRPNVMLRGIRWAAYGGLPQYLQQRVREDQGKWEDEEEAERRMYQCHVEWVRNQWSMVEQESNVGVSQKEYENS